MENAERRTSEAPARRRFQLEAQGADITHDLRDAHQGSTIEQPMVNVNASHAIFTRGKCPLKREWASNLPTPMPWPLQRSSTHGHRWTTPWPFQSSPWSRTPWLLTPWPRSHFGHHGRHHQHAYWYSKPSINIDQMTLTATFQLILDYVTLIVNVDIIKFILLIDDPWPLIEFNANMILINKYVHCQSMPFQPSLI